MNTKTTIIRMTEKLHRQAFLIFSQAQFCTPASSSYHSIGILACSENGWETSSSLLIFLTFQALTTFFKPQQRLCSGLKLVNCHTRILLELFSNQAFMDLGACLGLLPCWIVQGCQQLPQTWQGFDLGFHKAAHEHHRSTAMLHCRQSVFSVCFLFSFLQIPMIHRPKEFIYDFKDTRANFSIAFGSVVV